MCIVLSIRLTQLSLIYTTLYKISQTPGDRRQTQRKVASAAFFYGKKTVGRLKTDVRRKKIAPAKVLSGPPTSMMLTHSQY